MMNVEQITSRLAQMPDQALQKYAMMNKDDPYIMALALSESRRRKQMRMAQQANPEALQQPRVADQALMEMGPGLDSLPTQDMDFAGGGIVAFADGGDVERYNGQTGSLTGGISPALLAQYNKESEEMGYGQRMQFSPEVKAVADQIRKDQQSKYLQQEQQRMLSGGREIVKGAPAPSVATMPEAGYVRRDPRFPLGSAAVPSAQGQMSLMATEAASGAAPTNTEGGLGATPEAAAVRKAAAPSALAETGPTVKGAKDLAGQFLDTKAMREDLAKFEADEKAAVEAARARREEGKPGGKAYSKFEEMLLKEEANAPKEKEDAFNVALLRFGLGAMAGRSPNAFANFGEAGGAALTEYSGAIKDMKKAAKERQKAFADIEQARRAEEREDYKSKQEFEDKAETRLASARKFGIQGIMEITGKSAEISSRIYDTQVREAGEDRRSRASIAARPRDLKGELADALMKGDQKRIDALKQAIVAAEGGSAGAGMENAKTRSARLTLDSLRKELEAEDQKSPRYGLLQKRIAALNDEIYRALVNDAAQSGDVDKNNPLLK